MLLNLDTGDGKTLPVEIAKCSGASQKAGNPPAKMRNPSHKQDSTPKNLGHFDSSMGIHTRIGRFDHRKRLLQVVTGPGFKRTPSLQTFDEVDLGGINAVSTVSGSGIPPDSLVSAPNFAPAVDPDRACISFKRSLVKG